MEEIEQMNNLFQQKQKELVMASSKVEELSRQLELLKNGKTENFHGNQSSMVELDRLYKELQVGLNLKKQSKLDIKRLYFSNLTPHSFICLYVWSAEKQTQSRSEL